MSGDKEKIPPVESKQDGGDHQKPKTSPKTASEAVADAPRAKKYQENFSSFSDGTPAINPLVLEDSRTGEKFYDARDRKANQPHKISPADTVIRYARDATVRGATAGPIKHEFTAYLPDYKTVGLPAVLPRLVEVNLGPRDNVEFERRFHESLHGRDASKLSDFDRQKLHNLAICDVIIDKYQDALTKQEMRDAGHFPEQLRGMFLAGHALEDGAALGATKSVLHKVIDEGALGDLTSGAAIGVAFGKVVAKLAANVNPWTRAAAIVLQTGGLALAIKQVGDIGQAGINGLICSAPALQNLCAHPTEKNFANAKETIEDNLGPPLADATLTALGIAAAHGIEKAATGGGKGSTRPEPVETNQNVPGKARIKHENIPESAEGHHIAEKHGDAVLESPKSAHEHFSVEGETEGIVRTLKFDGTEIKLFRGPGSGFFKCVFDKGSKAHIKVHVLTSSAEDLGKVQSVLIPELTKDPLLQKHVGSWKTQDPNFGLKGEGNSQTQAPTGFRQGAKGLTIYANTAEEALILQRRIDEICHRNGLNLPDHLKTGNCETVPGLSRRVAICRDTYPIAYDRSGFPGARIDAPVVERISSAFGLSPQQQLSSSQIAILEKQAGIQPGLLTYSRDGHLMLRGDRYAREYHGGWYATEDGAGRTFGKLTERPALYALYRRYSVDPCDLSLFSSTY